LKLHRHEEVVLGSVGARNVVVLNCGDIA
jgi:hypothetical protein